MTVLGNIIVASVAKNQKFRVLNFSREKPNAHNADIKGTDMQLHKTTMSVFLNHRSISSSSAFAKYSKCQSVGKKCTSGTPIDS